MLKHFLIRINGIVQGVGFRPFIYRLAFEHNIKGYVLNDTEGVTIEAEAEEENLNKFVKAIKEEFPPLAIIQEIKIEERPLQGYTRFWIEKSRKTDKKTTFLPPDTNLCKECLKELFDPNDRRYHYPFIVCTHCGPRFSIVKDIPYDRENTSMAPFPMCSECKKEYEDPFNRRFHTQPTACPACGPHLFLYKNDKTLISEDTDEIVQKTYELLKAGCIVAIKGVGGFHLACDATNDEAVFRLRERKRRPFKPFALMTGSIEKIEEFLYVSPKEKELLLSKERPIVILKEKKKLVSRYIAPYLTYIGIMLPYTPFQYMLFSLDKDLILVMTSGNLSDEPICFKDEEAFERLKDIADYFVTYNREIVAHSDDSVMFVLDETPFFIRRSKGFVPAPFLMKKKTPVHLFASGADLKNSFAIAKDNIVILSQYLGDLESFITQKVYKEAVAHFLKVFDVHPEVFISDMHPNYFTTYLADELAEDKRRLKVQHHHAHIVSVMAEHNLKEPVIGIAFDGTGFGIDRKIWGSEFLIADRKGFKRVAHFSYFMLPGGEKAIKEVWRIGLSLLYQAGISLDYLLLKEKYPVDIILQMLQKRLNSPEACSIGRIFDGVSAILGIAEVISTEAEAAQKLEEESLKTQKFQKIEVPFEEKGEEIIISTEELIKKLIELKDKDVPTSEIALSFHQALIEVSFKVVERLKEIYGIKKVILSGGAFQNRVLLKGLWEKFKKAGFEVFLPQKVPLNDGGIALGQIIVGQEKISNE
ncbi:carbamoyltransferase HypF [Thermodesulfobacterium hydrogeniphilum]|uniref:carbamoyltransferase HypF n=1 Tax=Thermodesulfobacterium hydrogeniphilum TaxID=161156 RepID=UPI00056FF8EA|nr:carbamoyltransferase HypF [Thermodesulfobacterium hydrogeniphilum]